MCSLVDTTLESKNYLKFNFDGGDLSSDAGLFMLKELISRMGIDGLINRMFHTNDSAEPRIHKDDENLLQVIYQVISAYFIDDCADELIEESVFTEVLDKEALASQSTLSCFYNRMDEDALAQFYDINRVLR